MDDPLFTPQFIKNPHRAASFFEENGFLIEEDVWDDEQISELNAAADNFPNRVKTDFRPLMHPHKNSGVFLKALRNKKIRLIMEALLGGQVSGLQTEFFFSAPGVKGFAVHQDNYFTEARKGVFASAWSPLVEISVENGGLYIFPGTHKEGILPISPLKEDPGPHQDLNARNEECVIPSQYDSIDLRLSRGSTVILHGHLAHGSHSNQSEADRRVLLSTYIRSGEKFRAGNTAQRRESPLDG